MKKILLSSLVIIIIIWVLLQLISPKGDNPVSKPENDFFVEYSISDSAKTYMHNACYDCHSNQTKYPWYSKVVPVSFLINHDVLDGRKHLNFSNWGEYTTERKAKKLSEIVEVVKFGEMPIGIYKILHPEAKVKNADFFTSEIEKLISKKGDSQTENVSTEVEEDKD